MNSPAGGARAASPTKMVPADGVQIATYERGQGKPLVMLSGLGTSACDGKPLADLLAQRARLITIDNRGAGRSVPVAPPFTLEQMAQDAVAVLDAYGLASVNLVGHSMGGMIAQLVAAAHPERVERLVLMSTHPGAQTATPSTPEARAAMFPERRLPREELVRRQFMVYVAPSFLRQQPEEFERMLVARLDNLIELEMWQAQLGAIMQSERAETVRAVRAPTLIVHGREDALVPFANGEKLHDLIPGSRLVALDDCGHIVAWEKPAAVAGVIAEFLAL